MDLIRPIIPKKTETDILAAQQFYFSNLKQRPVKDLYQIIKDLDKLGYLMNIATNDLEAATVYQLEKADIANFFIKIIGSDSGYGAKPEPTQLQAISQMIGLEPSEIVMVGDSIHDMLAAKKAHFKAFGVLTGVATKHDLQPYSDIVFADISYLLPWIKEQNGN